MGNSHGIGRLLDRASWKPSSKGRHVLVAFLDMDEATTLRDSQEARGALEEFLRRCHVGPVPITSLLMLVRSDGRSADQFIELTIDRRERLAWHGSLING
jgi:hypothetical protein